MDVQEQVAQLRERVAGVSPVHKRVALGALAVIAVVVLVVVGFGAVRSGSPTSPPGAAAATATPAATSASTGAADVDVPTARSTTTSVVVDVVGAVLHPGVVTLAFGTRVVDAIDAAGGARHDADTTSLDLAAKLVDGTRIYVPKVGEHVVAPPADGGAGASAGDGGSAATSAPSGPVDLNTATQAELEELPGIGPSLAQAILDERNRLGGFRSVDDLRQVRGIGDRRFADLKPLVTV